MTIDSMSMHINQFAPLLSGLGSQPAILDDATPLYQRYRGPVSAQLGADSDALATLLLHVDNRVEYAMELLRLMLSKRVNGCHTLPVNTVTNTTFEPH